MVTCSFAVPVHVQASGKQVNPKRLDARRMERQGIPPLFAVLEYGAPASIDEIMNEYDILMSFLMQFCLGL